MAAPTILIVGATGNTGRSVVWDLSELIKGTTSLANHRIICLTRNANSDVAEGLAKLPGVEIVEQDWIEIDHCWLTEHNVRRAYVASHNMPSHFAEEGQFYINCLRASVKYIVRISTTSGNVRANSFAYYSRSHWAIENLLSQPEFEDLAWTSLQANGFMSTFVSSAFDAVKDPTNLKKATLSVMIDANTPVGLVDHRDVGKIAARLLASEDFAPHNQKKYVISGPENTTGKQVVELVERNTGTKFNDVTFADWSFIDLLSKQSSASTNLMQSMKHASEPYFNGGAMADTTSKEVLEIYAPRGTVAGVMEEIMAGKDIC